MSIISKILYLILLYEIFTICKTYTIKVNCRNEKKEGTNKKQIINIKTQLLIEWGHLLVENNIFIQIREVLIEEKTEGQRHLILEKH